jgi:hypothetical protein
MAAIGMALVFVGYSVGLYAYILIRGYNVSPKQLFSSTWPPILATAEA